MSSAAAELTHATMTVDGVTYVAVPARIESTHLGYEDHGLFTLCLMCEVADRHQGMGHLILSNPRKDADGTYLRQEGTAFGLDLVMRILGVARVEKWEDLPGQRLLLLKERDEYGTIYGIANIDNPEQNHLIVGAVAREWGYE